jgi:hypothetical protein
MYEGGLSHYELYAFWAPLGFYDSHPPAGSLDAKRGGAWRGSMLRIYYSLLEADVKYVHTNQVAYISAFRGEDDKWISTTNNASPLANTK